MVSVMSDASWPALGEAVHLRLAFKPQFQIKDVLVSRPEPVWFEGPTQCEGNWTSEGLLPVLLHRVYEGSAGNLTPSRRAALIHEDISIQFETVLTGCRVPFRRDGEFADDLRKRAHLGSS